QKHHVEVALLKRRQGGPAVTGNVDRMTPPRQQVLQDRLVVPVVFGQQDVKLSAGRGYAGRLCPPFARGGRPPAARTGLDNDRARQQASSNSSSPTGFIRQAALPSSW